MSRATMSMPPPPPLLLTKRVTAFLHANLQNQSLPGSSQRLHTTALTTPGGKLLAHASTANLPARALRRQCAVAASLWALHAPNTPFSEAVHSSSSSTHSQSDHGHGGSRSGGSGGGAAAITVQLDSGMVFVIRRLECGMLFVAMGGAAPSDGSSRPGTAQTENGRTIHQAAHQTQQTQTQIQTNPTEGATEPTADGAAGGSPQQGSPSEESILSAGTAQTQGTQGTVGGGSLVSQGQHSITSQQTTTTTGTGGGGGLSTQGVLAMRRYVEELARWLDQRLGSLNVPEEGIGIHFNMNMGMQHMGMGVDVR